MLQHSLQGISDYNGTRARNSLIKFEGEGEAQARELYQRIPSPSAIIIADAHAMSAIINLSHTEMFLKLKTVFNYCCQRSLGPKQKNHHTHSHGEFVAVLLLWSEHVITFGQCGGVVSGVVC